MAEPGTICLAVYRPEPKLLAIQINSLRKQSLSDWVCLVGVDGPDHDAESLLKSLIDGDPRFFVTVFENNVGFYRNFERILAEADPRSPWIALSDQDDFWYPSKLRTLVAALLSEKHTMLVQGQAQVVDTSGQTIGLAARHFTTTVDLIFNNVVTGSFSVLRPEVLAVALPFPAPTDVAYHDHWIGLCASMLGEVTTIETPLQDYVQHEANVVGEAKSIALGDRWIQVGDTRSSTGRKLAYIRDQRWGWRSRMAQTALARSAGHTTLTEHQLQDVRLIARGRASLRLTLLIVKSVTTKVTPPSRGAAHLVGMLTTRKKV